MPLTADSIAVTADWPCRKKDRYIVIWPRVIARLTVLTAIQA